MSEWEDEAYLGGFYSPLQLGIGKFSVGAGVYATNRRLFILGHGKSIFRLGGIVPGADHGDFVPTNLSREQNNAILSALRQDRHAEIEREKISGLELKKPPGVFRTGYLKINLTNGGNLEIKVAKDKEYQWLLKLLQSFAPDALKQV